MRSLLRIGFRPPRLYCGLSAASPQEDHKRSTSSNGTSGYKTCSVPCFVGSQRLPSTKGWFWVNNPMKKEAQVAALICLRRSAAGP